MQTLEKQFFIPKRIHLFLRTFSILSAVLLIQSMVYCSGGELRGWSELSPDGRTYLVVEDDNGGGCGSLFVDGIKWPEPMKNPHAIGPGSHTISCGSAVGSGIGFEIRRGTTFHFDYWGP